VQAPEKTMIESICVLYGADDAVVYDVGRAGLHNVYTAARLLRGSDFWRSYQLQGKPVLPAPEPGKGDAVTLVGPRGREGRMSAALAGYDRLDDGVRVRWRWHFASATLAVEDTLRLPAGKRRLAREFRVSGLPGRSSVEVSVRVPGK